METTETILKENILEFAELKEIKILDEKGAVLLSVNQKHFFKSSWVHMYNGKFYFSYSTGESKFIFYATGDNPYGPFTYQGRILNPFAGHTFHHSIREINNEWYLFYDNSSLSKGINLRSVKVAKIDYTDNGKIIIIDPYGVRRLN